MQVDAILRVEWQNHVPDAQGKLQGQDLESLQNIIRQFHLLDDNGIGILKEKCISFIDKQQDGLEFVKARRICESILEPRTTLIQFSDKKDEQIEYYLEALVKDFPSVRSKLKKITSDEYNDLILNLYPIAGHAVNKGAALRLLRKMELNIPSKMLARLDPNINSLSDADILGLLKEKEALAANAALKIQVLKRALEIVKGLDYKNRNDFKTAVEIRKTIDIEDLYKNFLGKQYQELSEQEKGLYDLYLLLNTVVIPNQTYDAKDLGLFKSLVLAVFNFLNFAIPHWIEVDRKFLYEMLSDVPGLHIDVPENAPEAFWEWISTLKTLEAIRLPKSTTLEQFQQLPPTVKAVDASSCVLLNGNIIPRLPEKIERLYLTTPSDTNYTSIKDNFSKDEIDTLRKRIHLVFDGTYYIEDV